MAFGLKVEGGAWPWRILLALYASAMLIIIKSATVTVATRCILRKRDGTIFRRKGGSLLQKEKRKKKKEKEKVVQKIFDEQYGKPLVGPKWPNGHKIVSI